MQNELAEIQVFVKVVECGSLSAAAREMRRSPSSVSKLIQRMEQRLGLRLLQRSSRSVALTEEGRQIFEVGRRALEAVEEVSKLASERAGQVRGKIRIYTLLTFAIYALAPHLAEFKARYPHLSIELILDPNMSNLVEHNIDVGIYVGVPPDSALISRTIAHTRWIICASPDYLREHGTPTAPEELRWHECLNITSRAEWNRWPLQDEGYFQVSDRVISTNSGEMALTLARQGLGIVRLAHYHVAEDLRSGRLVPLLEGYSANDIQPIALVYPSRDNMSPRVRAFCDFVTEKFHGTPPWAV